MIFAERLNPVGGGPAVVYLRLLEPAGTAPVTVLPACTWHGSYGVHRPVTRVEGRRGETSNMTALSRRSLFTLAGGGLATAALTRLPSAAAEQPGDVGALAASYRQGGAAAPRGLHLSVTGDAATTRTVTWFTDGASDPGTVVRWAPAGKGNRPLDRAPDAQTVTGTASPIPGVDGLVHRATLTGLSADAPVRYAVGGASGFSEPQLLSVPSYAEGLRFAVIGDHGVEPTSRATTDAVLDADPDLVLFAGDLSYANGDQPVWDRWFDEIEPLVSGVPMMAAPGNHENKDFGGKTFKERLSQPGRGSFYSFDMGRVHVAVGTAGVFLADGTLAEELLFLESDLAAAAARRALGELDFIVVMQHYPIWTDHESRGPLNPSLVLAQEHIYQRYQIDLLLTGHDHFYERSVRMAYGRPSPAGYVQVISGGGGTSLYDFVPNDAFQGWSAAHAKRFHFTDIEVTATELRGRAVATDGSREVLDTFTVSRRGVDELTVRSIRSVSAVLGDTASVTEADRAASHPNC